MRVVTEESKLAVLDVIADNWPCDARSIAPIVYPNPAQHETGRDIHRVRTICNALEDEGLIKVWSIGSHSQLNWQPFDTPSFAECYEQMKANTPSRVTA